MTVSRRRVSKPARRALALTHPIFVKLTFSQSGLPVKSTDGGPKIRALAAGQMRRPHAAPAPANRGRPQCGACVPGRQNAFRAFFL